MTDKELNMRIFRALLEIREKNTNTSGKSFENEVYNVFKKHLKTKNDDKIVCKVSNDGTPIDGVKRKDGDNLVTDNGVHIVVQPNKTQSWPDMLVVNKGKALCFEIKSSKTGEIVWNSGFPKENCIYIYKDRRDNRVYYFHGKDRLHDKSVILTDLKNLFDSRLKDRAKKLYSSSVYQPLRDSNITHYTRSMWNDSVKYSNHSDKNKWIGNVYKFILNYKWN